MAFLFCGQDTSAQRRGLDTDKSTSHNRPIQLNVVELDSSTCAALCGR